MAIRTIITRGYGNGTFNGTIALIIIRGYNIAAAAVITGTVDLTLPNTRSIDFILAEQRDISLTLSENRGISFTPPGI